MQPWPFVGFLPMESTLGDQWICIHCKYTSPYMLGLMCQNVDWSVYKATLKCYLCNLDTLKQRNFQDSIPCDLEHIFDTALRFTLCMLCSFLNSKGFYGTPCGCKGRTSTGVPSTSQHGGWCWLSQRGESLILQGWFYLWLVVSFSGEGSAILICI